MYAQVVAFVVSGIIIIQWLVASFLYILVAPENPHRGNIQPTVRLVGSELDNLAGTIMLSLAYTFVVPSWINIKRCDVNVQKTLWASSMITCAMYLFIGIIPTLAFPLNEAAGGNILPTLAQLGIPHSLTKITCHSFSLVMLLPSIPVSCIVSKNNLVQNGVCSNCKH